VLAFPGSGTPVNPTWAHVVFLGFAVVGTALIACILIAGFCFGPWAMKKVPAK
jgi:hypothetical protein